MAELGNLTKSSLDWGTADPNDVSITSILNHLQELMSKQAHMELDEKINNMNGLELQKAIFDLYTDTQNYVKWWGEAISKKVKKRLRQNIINNMYELNCYLNVLGEM